MEKRTRDESGEIGAEVERAGPEEIGRAPGYAYAEKVEQTDERLPKTRRVTSASETTTRDSPARRTLFPRKKRREHKHQRE